MHANTCIYKLPFQALKSLAVILQLSHFQQSAATEQPWVIYIYILTSGSVHSSDTRIVGLGCPQQKTTKIYCPVLEGATHSTFQQYLSASMVLQLQLSGIQQGLVASQWCKILPRVASIREGTPNDVQKYMIHSQLSNVSNNYIKSLLAQAKNDAGAPFFQLPDSVFVSMV